MRFVYDGFTHESGMRCFHFRNVDAGEPASVFTIEVDLALLSRNKLSLQEAPLFCLRILQSNVMTEEEAIQKFRPYRILPDDFRTLNADRARREAELKLRKHVMRRRPIGSTLPVSLFGAKV